MENHALLNLSDIVFMKMKANLNAHIAVVISFQFNNSSIKNKNKMIKEAFTPFLI